VKIVEQRVMNKKSKDEIRRELENSCGRLKKFSVKCKNFVDKYSDKIVDLIMKELGPKVVCNELMFCVSLDDIDTQDYDSGLEILMMAEREPEGELMKYPQCVICEFAMSKLDKKLNNTKTAATIKNALRTVCSDLPSSVGRSCKQFIEYYFDMVVTLLVTMKPAEVCSYMKLCPKPKFDDVMMMVEKVNDCGICKGLVKQMDSFIQDPHLINDAIDPEAKACEEFKEKYQPKCIELVRNYGILIVSHLNKLTDQGEVCVKLNLCSPRDSVDGSRFLKLT